MLLLSSSSTATLGDYTVLKVRRVVYNNVLWKREAFVEAGLKSDMKFGFSVRIGKVQLRRLTN